MDPETSEIAEPAHLRLLRRLVTALTITMIVGLVTIVGLLVTTVLDHDTSTETSLTLAIPTNETVQAYTKGTNWQALVTQDATGTERIRIFGSDGTERQTITIETD